MMKLKKYQILHHRSGLEAEFSRRWMALCGPPLVRELRFDPERKWRFDFAHPESCVAIECEGGVYSGGRHMRSRGFVLDCEKYNRAQLLGWIVFRLTHENMGWDFLEEMLRFIKQRAIFHRLILQPQE